MPSGALPFVMYYQRGVVQLGRRGARVRLDGDSCATSPVSIDQVTFSSFGTYGLDTREVPAPLVMGVQLHGMPKQHPHHVVWQGHLVEAAGCTG